LFELSYCDSISPYNKKINNNNKEATTLAITLWCDFDYLSIRISATVILAFFVTTTFTATTLTTTTSTITIFCNFYYFIMRTFAIVL
jgi:hypothetical protein